MSRLIRKFARSGQHSDVWPVALLLFAVLVPAVGLLGFMGAAMRNERFAAHQKLADAYRGQLSLSQARLDQHWNETIKDLEARAHATPAAAAFARCVQSGRVDSVILLDEQGNTLYPNTPSARPSRPDVQRAPGNDYVEMEPKWAEAGRLEHLRKDYVAAADRYAALASAETDIDISARAWQAQARCLRQAGRSDAAIEVVDRILGEERYDRAVDAQGRLIAANAELMALELLTNHTTPAFQTLARRLAQRLVNYDGSLFAASQRRFLMKELRRLAPQFEFPTLGSEELAAELTPAKWGTDTMEEPGVLHRSSRPGLWLCTTPDRRVVALVHSELLLTSLQPIIAPGPLAPDADVALLPPDTEPVSALVTQPVGNSMPGWRLALSLKDPGLVDSTTRHGVAVYLWAGILVVAAMGVLSLLAVRLLRRQMALARLKNDLAATVSHELKTPLASMRVLVDTLLDSDRIEEKPAREYLQLIARENDRLSRVIQNFLTFSRMERRMHTFDFVPVSPGQIIASAVQATRERLDVPGCQFKLQIEENLPDVAADPEALTTALINLLDNACKYSEDIKHITLRVFARDGRLCFAVRDNGIGIASRETKRIFQPFHQADQRLSRKGSGCGLGLSIVQHIVNAHGGSVSVESRPGAGSTFTLSIPAPRPVPSHSTPAEAKANRRNV